MKSFPLALNVLREFATVHPIPRQPEPHLIMDVEANVRAFDAAGSNDGPLAPLHLFNTIQATRALQGCEKVVDLGCGSAQLLIKIALANPEIEFYGLDLSGPMLEIAKDRSRRLEIANLNFKQVDIIDMSEISDYSQDGVISSLALHHLPDVTSLRKVFSETKRILKPKGALFIMDLIRFKNYKMIEFMVNDVKDEPPLYVQDYHDSLVAAFDKHEFKWIQKNMLGLEYNYRAGFLVGFSMMIFSQLHNLSSEKKEFFKTKLNDMSDKNKHHFHLLALQFGGVSI